MKYKREQVTWLDNCSTDQWTDLRDIVHKLSVIDSVGFVVHENDELLVLAGHVSDEGLATGLMTIAKKMITERGVLE